MEQRESARHGPLDNPDIGTENARVAAAGRQWETYMGFVRTIATVAFIVALPVALLTTNIRLLANSPLTYRYAFDRYDAEASTGLSRPDLDSTASALRDYFNNDESTFFHSVTEGGLSASVFNARETRHMEDVKHLFVLVNRVQEFSVMYVLVYVVVFFIWARDGSVRQLAGQSLLGLGLGALCLGAVGGFAAFGFDAAFNQFHHLAFSNDFWQLNPDTDHLVQMFPEPFWRDMTGLLGAMCAGEAFFIGAAAIAYLMGSRAERRRLPARVALDHSRTQAA